jgi:hypothetical protein
MPPARFLTTSRRLARRVRIVGRCKRRDVLSSSVASRHFTQDWKTREMVLRGGRYKQGEEVRASACVALGAAFSCTKPRLVTTIAPASSTTSRCVLSPLRSGRRRRRESDARDPKRRAEARGELSRRTSRLARARTHRSQLTSALNAEREGGRCFGISGWAPAAAST